MILRYYHNNSITIRDDYDSISSEFVKVYSYNRIIDCIVE